MKKNENNKIAIFWHFVYIWWVLKLLLVFFFCVERLSNPAALPKLPAKPGRYYQQKLNFNRTTACSQHCPLRHEHHHCGIGIPSDLRFRPEQSTTFPGLCLPVTSGSRARFQRASPAFNSTEKANLFTISDHNFRLRQKRFVILDKILNRVSFIRVLSRLGFVLILSRPGVRSMLFFFRRFVRTHQSGNPPDPNYLLLLFVFLMLFEIFPYFNVVLRWITSCVLYFVWIIGPGLHRVDSLSTIC